MTKVRRWGLPVGAAFAVALIALTVWLNPELRAQVFEVSYLLYLGSWGAMLVGGVLSWALARTVGDRRSLDAGVTRALVGHPLRTESAYCLIMLVVFLLSMAVLTWVFSLFEADMGADLAMSVSLVTRLLFLLALPLLFLDRSGLTKDGRGANMAPVTLKVREPWRWSGLLPAVVTLALMALTLMPKTELPPLSLALIGFFCAFVVISVCEEIFFRGLLQTRLEIFLGRWGGIVAASTVFGLTYALIQSFDAISQLPGEDLSHDVGMAMLSYGAAGLFYGYLWACFRNLWVNVLVRLGVFLLLVPPDLAFGIAGF